MLAEFVCFPLNRFDLNAYALHPPETVRCFIDARTRWNILFIEKPPCQQFVTPCIGCPYIGSRKNKGKIFQASVCASFFPLHGSVRPLCKFIFFFSREMLELFFKCSGFFFIVHNLIIKMFLAKEWFSFPLLVKIFHALRLQIPWQCFYLFLIWALNYIECGCASGYKYKFISGEMIGKWIDRIKCFSFVISYGSYSDVYICSMDFLLIMGIERINSNGKIKFNCMQIQ